MIPSNRFRARYFEYRLSRSREPGSATYRVTSYPCEMSERSTPSMIAPKYQRLTLGTIRATVRVRPVARLTALVEGT